MRYFEIAGGFRVPVDSEEWDMIDAYNNVGKIPDDDLNERGQEVARKMVSKGLLNRLTIDTKIYYEPNSLIDLWRF